MNFSEALRILSGQSAYWQRVADESEWNKYKKACMVKLDDNQRQLSPKVLLLAGSQRAGPVTSWPISRNPYGTNPNLK
jgi:hypothetical protein